MSRIIALSLTIGLGLLPVPLDAATQQAKVTKATKPAASRPAQVQQPASKNRIVRIRHLSTKALNAQHSSQSKARRQAAAMRLLIQMRQALLGTGQTPRLLDQEKIRSVDGDTFTYGTERIRIHGINAPEKTDIGGAAATQQLDSLLHEGPVIIIPQGQDAYGRTLADVFVKERNVAEVMKQEGYEKR